MVDTSTDGFAPWTRSHILDTAGRMFGTLGIRPVSLKGIAEACEMNTDELINQFQSKEDILQMYVAQLHINLNAFFYEMRSAENAIDSILRSVPVMQKLFQEVGHDFLLELESDYPVIWRKMEGFRDGLILDLILANLKRGRDEGIFRTDLDVSLVAVQRLQDLLDLHSRALRNEYELEESLFELTHEYLDTVTNRFGKAVIAQIDIPQFA